MENLNKTTLNFMLGFYARLNAAQDNGLEVYHLMSKGLSGATAQKALNNMLVNPTITTLSKIGDSINEFNGENDE